MASMNTRLNIEKLDGNIVQKHGGSKQVGFKQLGPGVETGVHGVHDEKRVWFEVELQGAQGDREAEVFQVSNDDTAVAQRWLEDKQPEEKTNTDCLVKEQEKEYQTGWKIKTGNVLDSCNQRSTQQCTKSGVAKHLGVAGLQQQNGLVKETNVTLLAKSSSSIYDAGPLELFSCGKMLENYVSSIRHFVRACSDTNGVYSVRKDATSTTSSGNRKIGNVLLPKPDDRSYGYKHLVSSASRISLLLSSHHKNVYGTMDNKNLNGARVGVMAKPSAEFDVSMILSTEDHSKLMLNIAVKTKAVIPDVPSGDVNDGVHSKEIQFYNQVEDYDPTRDGVWEADASWTIPTDDVHPTYPPTHPSIPSDYDVKDAFSSTNAPNYTPTSLDYSRDFFPPGDISPPKDTETVVDYPFQYLHLHQ
ncbi:hypothetical protein Tco_1346288 [Tanacetum coccineum]